MVGLGLLEDAEDDSNHRAICGARLRLSYHAQREDDWSRLARRGAKSGDRARRRGGAERLDRASITLLMPDDDGAVSHLDVSAHKALNFGWPMRRRREQPADCPRHRGG